MHVHTRQTDKERQNIASLQEQMTPQVRIVWGNNTFLFCFCFFETEILAAQDDLEPEYIVDNDLDLIILLLPPLKCWDLRCMLLCTQTASRTQKILWKLLVPLYRWETKVQQPAPSTGPGHLSSALSHPSYCPKCLRAKNAVYLLTGINSVRLQICKAVAAGGRFLRRFCTGLEHSTHSADGSLNEH